MPNRRAHSPIIVDSDDNEGLESMESSQSNGSDGHTLELAFARHCAELRAKMRKGKEQKFLAIAQNQLSQDLSHPTEELQKTGKTLDALYSGFVRKYAECEDRIRGIWVQIQEEQKKITDLIDKCHKANLERGEKIEEEHIAGMSRVKGAIYDFQQVIDEIIPQGKRENVTPKN